MAVLRLPVQTLAALVPRTDHTAALVEAVAVLGWLAIKQQAALAGL